MQRSARDSSDSRLAGGQRAAVTWRGAALQSCLLAVRTDAKQSAHVCFNTGCWGHYCRAFPFRYGPGQVHGNSVAAPALQATTSPWMRPAARSARSRKHTVCQGRAQHGAADMPRRTTLCYRHRKLCSVPSVLSSPCQGAGVRRTSSMPGSAVVICTWSPSADSMAGLCSCT